MSPKFFKLDPPYSFIAGQLVKLHPSWQHGYIAYQHSFPRIGWPDAVLIESATVGVYIKFIDEFVSPSPEIMASTDGLGYPYYPVDVVLFGDQLVELPTDVIVPVIE